MLCNDRAQLHGEPRLGDGDRTGEQAAQAVVLSWRFPAAATQHQQTRVGFRSALRWLVTSRRT